MRLRAFLALALILAACGGAAADTGDGVASLEDPTVTTTAADETADPEAAAIAFTECMRENGVEMEDPTVDADGNVMPGRPTELPEPEEGENGERIVAQAGEVSEELGAAFEECGDLLEGTAFGFTDVDQTELQDQLLELAQCLRDQGLEVADPDLSEPGQGGEPGQDIEPGQGGPFGIDFQDPAVQAAMEQCQELVPNFAGGPGGRPGFNDEGAGSVVPDGTDDSNN
jgi:hypothetical protein